jgi:hypothetical protein
LESIHKLGARVAGIAIDVEGGDENDRPGLEKALEWIDNGNAHCLLAPTPNRLDRDEVNFGARMKQLGESESWLYYGRSYGDLRMSALVWRDIPSRDRPVSMVRSGEQYLAEGRSAVGLTNLYKLEQGLLLPSRKQEKFCLYDVESLDKDKPMAERKLSLKPTAASDYVLIKERILAAAENDDGNVIAGLARDFSQKFVPTISAADLLWELRIGWVIGINQASPYSSEQVYASVPELTIEDSEEEFESLLTALDYLESLNKRTRLAKPRGNHVEEFTKSKIAELQEHKKKKIAYRLTCNCTDEGTLVKYAGLGPENEFGFPVDFVFCPACQDGRKVSSCMSRQPDLPTIRQAMGLPDDQCTDCGTRIGLRHSFHFQFGKMMTEFWKCGPCHNPIGAIGKKTFSLESFDSPRPSRPKSKGIHAFRPLNEFGVDEV